MHRSTSFVRRACAVGTATALIGLTTGLGVMTATTASAAEAPTTGSSVAAPVPPGADTTAPGADATTPGAGATAPAEPGLPADGATSAPGGTTPMAPVTAAPAPSGSTSTKPSATSPAEAAPAAAAAATVTISGTAKVGETLNAKPKGFTDPAALAYRWSVDGVVTGDQGSTYDVVAADAGKVVSVTVQNTSTGHTDETATTSSAVVRQAPVFVDAAGAPVVGGTDADEDVLPLGTTAGEAFSYTFRTVGFPAPELTLAWFYDGLEADPEFPEDTPEGQLPEGITFDAETGVLSGTAEWASSYDFAVTASNGTDSVTQYVELTVDAAAPVGVEVFASDRADYIEFIEDGLAFGFEDDAAREGSVRSWIIDADGDIDTLDLNWSTGPEGGDVMPVVTPGGQPTVAQGGTLLVNGGVVDRFGNQVIDEEGDLSPVTVTSDVASDVVTVDEDFGGFTNFVDVTFPHASTHTLTVASEQFATSFPVEVVPTATAPVATPPIVTPPTAAAPIGTVPVRSASHGRLAYTGSDSTDALPWALGMLAAGAAMVGLRIVRRRAQR
ncbi:putative Ig domain-containing protein [Curtobacterium sp. MCSS17_015]|uniref:putative Ig domain-containing protein n=1 Tax=Curtobacterium sp. MCSS17_015 TaxID=2175666 RepID=UPI000DA7E614|nr:putative Ig domain-containing protein [Curtobacterium sp. MCSS17_015]WIB27576.1 putative Ig domain-containing protein [Curtobacterium sp. MCSS17_015]